MATENIIGPEFKDNQQEPPATPARCLLSQIFATASTPFTAIRNQLLPQDVIICNLERELDINQSPAPSDITSTPSDREPQTSEGDQNINEENEERPRPIAEINLVHHQEEDDNTNENEEDVESEESEEENNRDRDSSEEAESDSEGNDSDNSDSSATSSEISFGAVDASKIADNMSSSSSNDRQRTGRSVRTRTPPSNQPLTYTLNGITVRFPSSTPPTNAIHNVGVVYSCLSRPSHGSDAERKMVDAISKNQHSKFIEHESSLKDVLKLEESQGLDETICHLRTFLETYDLLPLFTIVLPTDRKLCVCTLKLHDDGKPITYDLLTEYRTVTPKIVGLSTAWFNKYGYFIDNQNNKQTLGRDMSWSLLHFKQHVQASLHTDIDLRLQQYPAIERGGPLYFALLMEELVLSNEQSCEALVSLVQAYNIAINDDSTI